MSVFGKLYSLFSKSNKGTLERHQQLIKILGYRPSQFSIYIEAITHSSSYNVKKKQKHNERLEFLGDSVLDLIVSNELYKQFPTKNEGELTKLRSLLVNRSQLNAIAEQIGLSKIIAGIFNNNIMPEDVKGNALEALIGAIYIDKGLNFTYQYAHKHILNKLIETDKLLDAHRDFKSELYMWAQKHRKRIQFSTIEQSQTECDERYLVNVSINNTIQGSGLGKTKKRAQQNACQEALEKLDP